MKLFNKDTMIKELLKDERAVEIIERYIPNFKKHPALPIAKLYTFEGALKYKRLVGMSDETAEKLKEEIYSIEE